MSESRPKMTPEAVAHREPLKDKSTTELFDSVSDLVDDRLSADSGKLRYKAGATIGEDGASKRVGGRFESRSQLEDVAAYESQIRLGMLAKEAAPALEVVDTALAAAYAKLKLQNERSTNKSTLKEVAVIRRALVESGTVSALDVGNLSDDEVTEMISYARLASEPTVEDAPDDVPATGEDTPDVPPTLDTSAIDAHFGDSLPFETKKLDAFFDGGTFDTSAIDSYFGDKPANGPLDTSTIDAHFGDTDVDGSDVDTDGTDVDDDEDDEAIEGRSQGRRNRDRIASWLTPSGLGARFHTLMNTRNESNPTNRRRTLLGAGGLFLAGLAVGAGAMYLRTKGHDFGDIDLGSGGDSGPGFGDSGNGAAPDAPSPELHDLLDSDSTYNVRAGEGWNETLESMGVPSDQWGNVLEEAGPELKQQGWAYFDNANSEWRITKPGTLSEDALKVLKTASANHGYSFN